MARLKVCRCRIKPNRIYRGYLQVKKGKADIPRMDIGLCRRKNVSATIPESGVCFLEDSKLLLA